MALESYLLLDKNYLPDSKSKLKQTEFWGRERGKEMEEKDERRRKKGRREGHGEKNPEDLHFILRCLSLNFVEVKLALPSKFLVFMIQ